MKKQVETEMVQTAEQDGVVTANAGEMLPQPKPEKSLSDSGWVYDKNFPGARAIDALVQKIHKLLKPYNGPIEDALIEKARKERKNDKLVILGTAGTMKDAPFGDDSFDIWTVSTATTHGPELVKRVTRLFEIHCDNKWKNRQNRIPLMNSYNVPVYMQIHNPEIPKSVPYPIGTILNKHRDYMTNSISWMIALAIEEGYKEIHFYGVHMVTSSEYADEMPSCEYFIGLAEGKGIKCVIPAAADMCKATKLYGYEEFAPGEERLRYRLKDLKTEKANLENQHHQLENVINQYIGAVEDQKFVLGMYER